MPALPLTPDQQADALRLKNVYESRKAALGITQDSLAAACGWESQGTVSQYMNGKIPLNLDAALKFSVALRCSIEDFSPSLAETLKRSGYMKRDSVLSSNGHLAGLSGAKREEISEVVRLMRAMDDRGRTAVVLVARSMAATDCEVPIKANAAP